VRQCAGAFNSCRFIRTDHVVLNLKSDGQNRKGWPRK
jgi:hypothetical protein